MLTVLAEPPSNRGYLPALVRRGERTVLLRSIWLGKPFRAWHVPAVNSSVPTRERSGDEISADRFRLIADKIEADPALLEIPLANIARWLAQGHSARARLEGWRTMILDAQASEQGMARLLFLLRDQDWESVLWKDFSPFPGILSKAELKELSWTSAH